MKHLNRWRLCLNVTTLLDILEGDGATINKDALQRLVKHDTSSQYKYPNQKWLYQKA